MLPRYRSLYSLALLLALALPAQNPIGQTAPNVLPLAQVVALDVPALDLPAITVEDDQRHAAGQPARYAIPFPVDVTPATHGTWENVDAAWSLWRLRIRAPNSAHVNLGFRSFKLPPAARLQVYAADYSFVVRPFDRSDASPEGELWTPVVRGDAIVVELYLPTASRPLLDLRLSQVGAGYRYFGAGHTALGLDGSGACNVDVVCPQGAAWVAEIPSVAAISTGGSIFCTGFMVNNTAVDGRNFFMTAYHCGIRSTNQASLVCYWNYQNTLCGGADNGTLTQFNTGSTLRAEYSVSDFTLVELNVAPNPAWGVTHAGWNRGTATHPAAIGIHHPQGDPKKISFENNATQITSYLGTTSPGDGTHVRIVDWDVGTTEPGSSGSPLFDDNHRVIGQLHGGSAACGNNLSDYYGRFAISWTGGGANGSRLSNWLDPLGTGAQVLDTAGNSAATATAYGAGCYERNAAFYESFGTFDLGGTAVTANVVRMTPTANGYTVAPAPSAWFTPIAANLGLADDAVSAALNLPFAFQHAGGTTTQVRVCSNGFVWLSGAATGTDFTPTPAELVSGGARLCPLWMDLNPAAGGTIHFDVELGNAAVYATWSAVPAFNVAGSSYTFQLALRSNGQIELRWRSTSPTALTGLVGYAPGVVVEPPLRDLSASMPFTTGPDALGLNLRPTNRPVQGTNQTMVVENIPVGTVFGAVFLGWTQHAAGLDLTALGMPGCRQYASTEFQFGAVMAPPTYNFAIGIPTGASWRGVHMFSIAAVLVPGVNALGALASNGVDLKFDIN